MRAPARRLVSSAGDSGTLEALWTSLRYFNLYRIGLAAVFIGATYIYSDALHLGSHRLQLFRSVSVGYLGLALAYGFVERGWRLRFDVQVSLLAFVDIAAITTLMYASGGIRSGLGVMLLISLIGAALLAPLRLALLYAAIAAIALLLEQTYWVLSFDVSEANYLQPGLLAIGCFTVAGVTGWLAQRQAASETLAQRRGHELANQMRVNQRVIEDMHEGVLVVDRDGRVVQHNPRAQRLLDAETLLGEELAPLLPGFGAVWRAWREGANSTNVADLDVRGRGLRLRVAETGADPELRVLFLEDMTRSREQAQQLKLAALGRLTANIAHEIRNPLSAISHAVELIGEGRHDGDRTRLVRIAHDNVRRLERLVSDVLELSRRDRATLERIDLGLWLPSFLEQFAAGESVPIDRIAVSSARDAVIEFDREHLGQILWNLLRNAVRYASEARGSVRIELRRFARHVQLNVIDDGTGVPSSDQGQLFEPFFTTDSKGTGLGLYLARELCAANHALLEYVDDMKGAHFRIYCREAPA